jgi:hypothetical protein
MKHQTGRQWASQSPYDRFFDFIKPNADRFGILLEHTRNLNLNSAVITVNNNRHFFVFPQNINLKSLGGIIPFRGQHPVVLTAHYDRVAGSPGANDNSAAVFQLLKAAIRLNEQNIDQWIIIFTDKEELGQGEGIGEQGSFSLAQKLRSCGIVKARIFNFDACGTGDTFVFSSTTDYLLRKKEKPGLRRAGQTVASLREAAFGTARRLGIGKVLSAPVPFSDDAGFLKGGIPAQTITMLPTAEAAPYASLLRNRPEFAGMIIAGSIQNSADCRLIPETWRCLNSPRDVHLRLTPEHYDMVVRFAVELCKK